MHLRSLSATHSRRGIAVVAVAALTTSLCATSLIGPGASTAAGAPPATGPLFDRLATYPVFLNVPADVDPSAETVAEISAVTEDGNTVIYTDAAGQRIGFLDITDPSNPVGDGTIDLRELGDSHDEPTSVEVVGDYVLVVVDTSDGDFVNPSGRVDVVRISDRTRVRSIDLGGQPDSVKVSPDQAYAAIAIENQRDEDFTPDGGDEGDLPQAPTGFVQVLGLNGAPAAWSVDAVSLDAERLPGVFEPGDVEPEYVDINDANMLAVSLQENNALVVIDLATKQIDTAFSLGNAQITGVDTDDDGIFDFTDTIDVPREPDAIAWVGENLVATANEGDLYGGSRGWSVFVHPARITQAIDVAESGTPAENLDLEGIAARADGGFWLANEGKTGPANSLVRTDAAGAIQETVPLPADVGAGLGKNGLEGVAVQGAGATEVVTVVLQKPLNGETTARIGRYDVTAQRWTWFGYPLETTAIEGDFIGLSEVSVIDDDTVAVIERDKQNGTTAAIKRVYIADIPAGDPERVTPVAKKLGVDLLPAMQALNGWTQEKLEGLAITEDNTVYLVTDNDGVDDATGETQFFTIAPPATPVEPSTVATTTKLKATKKVVRQGKTLNFKVRVKPGTRGTVKLVSRSKRVGTAVLNPRGRATLRIKVRRAGVSKFRAVFLGADGFEKSSSTRVVVKVLQKKRR